MIKRILVLCTSAVLMAVGYTNCGGSFEPSIPQDALLASLSQCELSLYGTFESKIHPFVRNNCAECHSSGGDSGIYFAVAGAPQAFMTFRMTGFAKFKSMALNETHASGVTGPMNEGVVTDAEVSWLAAEAGPDCQAEGVVSGMPAKTIEKQINAPTAGTSRTIEWKLDTETEDRGAEFGGGSFFITIQHIAVQGGPPAYSITKPTLKAGTDGLVARGVFVYINGQKYSDGTTFALAYDDAAPGASQQIASGVMIKQMVDGILAADTIALEFTHIGKGTAPTPPPTPTPGATPDPTLPGIDVYNQYCATCHQTITQTSKGSRTFNQIKSAIANVTAMRNNAPLQTLTDAQIQQIADALVNR